MPKLPLGLSRYKGFLLDIDGVLVRGKAVLAGAPGALAELKTRGHVLFLTNNSTKSRQGVAHHLRSLGFDVRAEEAVPSCYVAAQYLRHRYGLVRFWTLGEAGILEEMTLAGHIPVGPEEAQWIVVGMDRELTYAKLAQALRALLRGARFLATNRDATFPTPDGLVPGAGAIVGALVGMGFEPEEVVGKPSLRSFEVALSTLGLPPHEVLMIGDRLETDVLGAQKAGLDTALVLTGISREQDIAQEGIVPTWVADSLADLVRGKVRPGKAAL